VRVVAGTVKGFELKVPRGAGTRPTSDKVRDAVFNVLGESVLDARVLDLFAGTGALSIEALSRGAAEAVLVESWRQACNIINANLEKTRFTADTSILCMSVSRSLTSLEGQFDLILLDPPYAFPDIHLVMETLGQGHLIADHGQVVLEHGKRFESRDAYGKLRRRQFKRYGDTAVSFYEIGGNE
jgi:16S rRNA (guanine966-N2)-methyltransferase